MHQAFDVLRPWLKSEQPNSSGEHRAHCPLHDDLNPSASVNFEKGVFHCQACGAGGAVGQLVDYVLANPEKQPPNGWSASPGKASASNGEAIAPLTEGHVAGWHSALLANDAVLMPFIDRRGIERTTIQLRQFGWDSTFNCYTIPVRNRDGELVNVRRYLLDRRGETKIWSLTGRGSPVLYPAELLPFMGDFIIICEGELDAVITQQHGFDAITRTGAAKTWKAEWNGEFVGKVVYLCHDADAAGEDGNRIVAASLESVVDELYVVRLPYEITPKHGKDLTDWWLEGHTREEFLELLAAAEPWGRLDESPVEPMPTLDITLLESFDAAKVGQHLRTRVTITGKQSPTYLVPELVDYRCDQQAGPKCLLCPMHDEFNGRTSLRINRSDPLVLKFLETSEKILNDLLRAQITPVKCGRLEIQQVETMSVEELFVRPSVEQYRINNAAGDYIHRKFISVGRHDTMPNNTVEVVGSIFPDPRSQHNEFQAWEVEQTQTSVDKFEVTPERIELLKRFHPRRLQGPLNKLVEIAKDLALHVTQIYGRTLMHCLMDLTFHSVLAYFFDGKLEPRGWLDTIIVGDTRTGKTEAAKRLLAWNGSGEYVACEAASFAGVVGGLQQMSGNQWTVTWGAVPINDRRLVVLDEVSGLTVEQIAQMSSIRSSGEAQLTKIQSERTYARTRLLWLGNPRDGKTMANFTHGAQAIAPLVGHNEDVARFDLAMSVTDNEVPSTEINRQHPEGHQQYSEEACQTAMQWAWSRKAEDVVWEKGSTDLVYKEAIAMGERYVASPPLVQSANIRMKITRVAVALAARLISTDSTYTQVLVSKRHVKDAVAFMDRLYMLPGFGYHEMSKKKLDEARIAAHNRAEVAAYLAADRPLAEYLRGTPGQFRRSDMADVLSLDTSEANAVCNRLWEWRMLSRIEGNYFEIHPELHRLLRGE